MTDNYRPRDFHAEALKVKMAEFESYYRQLLLAYAHNNSSYIIAYGMQNIPKQFAKELAAFLQRESGYICKVIYIPFLVSRHIICNFVPVKPSSQNNQ